jgi:hypothetical protein
VGEETLPPFLGESMKLLILGVLLFCGGLKAQTVNCNITSEVNATVTAAARTTMLAAKNRRCLFVQNKGTVPVYLFFRTATDGTTGIILGSSTIWIPAIAPNNAVYVRASTGSVSVIAGEGE